MNRRNAEPFGASGRGISSGPLARYIELHSPNSVAITLWPVRRRRGTRGAGSGDPGAPTGDGGCRRWPDRDRGWARPAAWPTTPRPVRGSSRTGSGAWTRAPCSPSCRSGARLPHQPRATVERLQHLVRLRRGKMSSMDDNILHRGSPAPSRGGPSVGLPTICQAGSFAAWRSGSYSVPAQSMAMRMRRRRSATLRRARAWLCRCRRRS